MLQVAPDNQRIYTPETFKQFGTDFPDLKFSGPGTYLSDTQTILIQGISKNPPKHRWAHSNNWPADTRWQVSVWDCPVTETILNDVGRTRQDSRENTLEFFPEQE